MKPTTARTREGVQFVLPGAERTVIAKARHPYRNDGDQLVIPGAEKISDKALAERMSEQPLRPRRQQKGLRGTLFDAEALSCCGPSFDGKE